MSNEMISFPRELSDDLAEFIAEKARVCGGGADEIWEALCERFGQPAEQHQGEVMAPFKNCIDARAFIANVFKQRLRRHDFDQYINERLAGDFAFALANWLVAEQHQGEPVLYVEQWELDRIAKGGASWATAWTTDGKENPSRPGDCVALYTRPAEQPEPISSTSDKYKAELYDEVWQLARDMGFGNVTDALMKLKKQSAPAAQLEACTHGDVDDDAIDAAMAHEVQP
ncbi:hypothetical protein [Pseudomonas sp. KCJK8993]|uniref:hypothetical protein n=1 Tax=Pseudomonas sp. KCJK8993 TaxID=3344565 RepID=UPI00390577FC